MSVWSWLRRWFPALRTEFVAIFYDEAYRLPLTGIENTVGVEPRGVDFTTWYLLEKHVVRPADVYRPRPVSYAELSRVHDAAYLESLGRPETLARIYAVDPSEVPVDTLLSNVRLVCGGTLGAARLAFGRRGPVVNMAGGFHHAAPGRGGGFCAVNDIAVALASLQSDGYEGQTVVLDLDAHPPDGTAECLAGNPKVWIGSLSGSDWGSLPEGVDETRVPDGISDDDYLTLLDGLLSRMPKADLAFVIAGGDVLAGDRFGRVGLSVEGARRRDQRIADALHGVPSVWLPGGGYHADSWKLFAGTVLVLSGMGGRRIKERYDPLSARYRRISRLLMREGTPLDDITITQEDLEGSLGLGGDPQPRVLGYYTAQSLEYALFRYGLLWQVERLGYSRPRVEVNATGAGDRIKVLGRAGGQEHLLVDVVVERRTIADEPYFFVNWLSLRHPRARFSERRPQLPGQEVPGLGLAREATEMFVLMARRLELTGVAFRPMWYHLAVVAKARFRFVDPARQGRFEALMRDLSQLPLLEATRAVADGRVLLGGEPYRWEPADMVLRLEPQPLDTDAVAAERERCHFTLEPRR
ncbi:histone deacetylase family protein [Myxococcus stipitatus DSM 14675]|uniref:Histone deacetylase family protein n=1 Tax=Myxococcus stipitatus (strain DSM 14675 / JCM 12634 / Mx s8) TaxID=1278073 RepID=L7U680_MYXSD|nr:histone deacetylase [Myxococcus stipitatus]AGC41944.1 histone deacetylase family protein [Myxococcus stipitatus DSM 14675]